MGVLSRARVSLAFTPATTEQPSGAAVAIGGPLSQQQPLPVFEYPESRRRAPAWGSGRAAYDEAGIPGPSTPPSYDQQRYACVTGTVGVDVEAGKIGRATVRAACVRVRLVRREATAAGPGELLVERVLWTPAAAYEEIDGSASFPFALPIHPHLAPSFRDVPLLRYATDGAVEAEGASYWVVAVLERPTMPAVEVERRVVLRHAVPQRYVRPDRVAVHKGSLPFGATYEITTPRVLPVSSTETYPVSIRIFSPSPPPSSSSAAPAAAAAASWTATSKVTEWFGPVPRPGGGRTPPLSQFPVIDVTQRDWKPVLSTAAVRGVITPPGVVALSEDFDDAGADDATLAGGGDDYDDDEDTFDGGESVAGLISGGVGESGAVGAVSAEGVVRVGTVGLRGGWCDGKLYSAHALEIVLAPGSAAAGGKRFGRKLPGGAVVVRVPVRVVYVAESGPEVTATWMVPEGWDEWPWRQLTVDGFVPLWVPQKNT